MGLLKLVLFCILLSQHSMLMQESKPVYTVYIFLSEDCPICRYYVPTINELSSSFASDSIRFIGVFPNFSSKPNKISSFVDDYKLIILTKTDYFKKLSTKLGATKTPEIIIVDNADGIVYKGRIDNAFAALGKRRRVVTAHDLNDFLGKLRDGMQMHYLETETIGCYINFSDLNE